MNAQMFLCVTASSWQKDLLLHMWCFSVWVQTEHQVHEEKPKEGAEQRTNTLTSVQANGGFLEWDGSISESKGN